MSLSWNEKINAISIDPDRASRDDVARMAAELSEANVRIAELEEELENVVNEVCLYSPSDATPNAAGSMVPLEPRPSEMVNEVLFRQKRRISELEAAAQWHPASEPPMPVKP